MTATADELRNPVPTKFYLLKKIAARIFRQGKFQPFDDETAELLAKNESPPSKQISAASAD